MGHGDSVDFDDEARKLFARYGLDNSGIGKGKFGGLYNPLDMIWKHPRSGGKVYVGNQQAASNATLLQQNGVTHVVNCTDNMPLYHESKNIFTYLRWNVAYWPSDDAQLQPFLATLFEFVDAALAGGGCVLVHCLAGAHRAGTTGCLLLMYLAGCNATDAVTAAKKMRPAIDPIGRFPLLLSKSEPIIAARRGMQGLGCASGGGGGASGGAGDGVGAVGGGGGLTGFGRALQ